MNPSDYEMLDVLQSGDDVGCVPLRISDEAGSGQPELSQRFIAPPDLLRYCKRNCNIIGLFADCGLSG